jgi:sugar/nucleoside kinase (ribokinase family)
MQNLLKPPQARSFDVICAGEALWSITGQGGVFSTSASLRFQPAGGAVNAAFALAQTDLRVGLATALGDDSFGRALLGRIIKAGIDAGGVTLAPPGAGLVFVAGGGTGRQIVPFREEERPVEVPEAWSAQVLLLSGLSPVVSHGGALCKAARAARRAGSIVVVDINARRHVWAGRDPRAIRMVLREADVARCSLDDLEALGVPVEDVRSALRPSAVLVVSNGAGSTWATGPFGKIALAPPQRVLLRAAGSGDAFTAAICAELARAGTPGEGREELWDRALRRGHEAAIALSARR